MGIMRQPQALVVSGTSSAAGTAKSEACFRRAPCCACVALPQTFRKIWRSSSLDRNGLAVALQVPLSNWLLCFLRETRARLTNVGSRHLVVVPPVTGCQKVPGSAERRATSGRKAFCRVRDC